MAQRNRGRVAFVCQECAGQSPRWMGRCPECQAWNSLVEVHDATPAAATSHRSWGLGTADPVALSQVEAGRYERLDVPIAEFRRVLGGGIVPGSVVLVGGDPGIGKSTLLLQVSATIAAQSGTVLYVSGEESPEQIKLRADRLDIVGDRLLVLPETALDEVMKRIDDLKPALVVIDSIQTMYLESVPSAAGSVTQVRECAMALMRRAKTSRIPIFLVGHVTKEGAIAGPRVLEHIVDTVLYLEGERYHSYRLLRGVKNRFGSTDEIGVFEMQGSGMVEVLNPSAIFLAERSASGNGSTVAVTIEGTRPLLVEIQALTTTTSFGLPRRTANGIEMNRLLLLTAVLTKRVGLTLANQDIYVNIVGGLKVSEPAADLAIATAIASSFRDAAVPHDLAIIGEVGLSGELRRVTQLEKRLAEAAKLGFRRCLIPAYVDHQRLAEQHGIQTLPARTLADALAAAWKLD
ncbi:MAG TPA: DNA repair protein RadA [Chloroflexota bacterium]|nr:DNA repair protein RadA [Chloroflexota bacterium]